MRSHLEQHRVRSMMTEIESELERVEDQAMTLHAECLGGLSALEELEERHEEKVCTVTPLRHNCNTNVTPM